MFRSSLSFVVAIIVMAGAAHAQVGADPQAVAPVVYSGQQLNVENCNTNDPAYGDGCATHDGPAIDDHAQADYGYAPDYVPDYYADAPVYSAPPVYLGISLLPDYYWGWPYYGYGYAYGPYYGYGCCWPYYGYGGYWGGAYWAGGYWGGHDHHDHNHGGGDWGHHGGGDWGHGGGDHNGHHGDYHGPYQYDGNGRYADQRGGTGGAGGIGDGRGGHGNPPAGAATRTASTATFSRAGTSTGADFSRAGTAPRVGTSTATDFSRAGATTGDRSSLAGAGRIPASSTNPVSGANRFAGRAPLPSASYYAAARGDGATRSAYAMNTRAGAATTMNDRAGNGYAYGRGSTAASGGSAVTGNRGANQSYRVASMPSRSYAPSSNRAGAQGGNVAPQNYAGSRSAYPQQHYAPSNRAYAHSGAPSYSAGGRAYAGGARGTMPQYSGARGAAPSYSGGRVAAPAYSHGGSGFAARGGGGHAAAAAPHSGGAGHVGSSRGH